MFSRPRKSSSSDIRSNAMSPSASDPAGLGEAISGTGSIPLGVESAGGKRRDFDGNGKAEILLESHRGYIVLMESP